MVVLVAPASPVLLKLPLGLVQSFSDSAERKYRKLLSGVELTKNFFFSYTYPLWRTLQANMSGEASSCPFDSMFVWNDFLTK